MGFVCLAHYRYVDVIAIGEPTQHANHITGFCVNSYLEAGAKNTPRQVPNTRTDEFVLTLEEIVELILKYAPEFDRKDILKMIKEKWQELGPEVADEWNAARIVARDLGFDVGRLSSPEEITKSTKNTMQCDRNDVLTMLSYAGNSPVILLDFLDDQMIPTDNHKVPTQRGEYVRSSEEALIADTLYALGAAYDYERPICPPTDRRDTVWPDFILYLNNTVYFWEHLGMSEDSSYMKQWELKKEWYQRNGYYLNLIVTNKGVTSEIVKEIAKNLSKRENDRFSLAATTPVVQIDPPLPSYFLISYRSSL